MHQLMSEFKVSSKISGGFGGPSSFTPAPAPASSWNDSEDDVMGYGSDSPFTGAKY